MNDLIRQSKLFLNRNASTILSCIGVVGVVTTSIMAVKATPKALMLIEKAEEDKGEELTKLEIVKVAGPSYIPSVIIGVSTIACIFGANAFNKRQQAIMTSAYALLDNSYKEYKNKVYELYGEDSGSKIREEIVKDNYEEKEFEYDEQLFYDYFSERYFVSTIEKVQRAEYQINRNLVMRDYAYLNEFYEELGIEPIDSGYKYGWSSESNMERYWQSWIDFDHEKVSLEDGMECIIIVMNVEPKFNFEDYS